MAELRTRPLRWANLATFLLILLQSALNPVIYFHRIPAFQAEIYAMVFPEQARQRATERGARAREKDDVRHRRVRALGHVSELGDSGRSGNVHEERVMRGIRTEWESGRAANRRPPTTPSPRILRTRNTDVFWQHWHGQPRRYLSDRALSNHTKVTHNNKHIHTTDGGHHFPAHLQTRRRSRTETDLELFALGIDLNLGRSPEGQSQDNARTMETHRAPVPSTSQTGRANTASSKDLCFP